MPQIIVLIFTDALHLKMIDIIMKDYRFNREHCYV